MHPAVVGDLSENSINFLSENAPVIFHILITIHNLYLLITSQEAREEEDVPPGTTNSLNTIDRTNCNGTGRLCPGSNESRADLLMCSSTESSGSSSGYCSASSPALINNSLSNASSTVSLEGIADEKEDAATERDNNYRECEDGQENPLGNRRRLGKRIVQVVATKKSHKLRKGRRLLKVLHFRHRFFSSIQSCSSLSCGSYCQVFS